MFTNILPQLQSHLDANCEGKLYRNHGKSNKVSYERKLEKQVLLDSELRNELCICQFGNCLMFLGKYESQRSSQSYSLAILGNTL